MRGKGVMGVCVGGVGSHRLLSPTSLFYPFFQSHIHTDFWKSRLCADKPAQQAGTVVRQGRGLNAKGKETLTFGYQLCMYMTPRANGSFNSACEVPH